jgi:transposase
LIADFCATKRPAAWQPPPPEASELQALVRRLESLQEMRQMEQNRLDESRPTERVAASLRQHLTYLDQEIASTQVAISEHIDQYPGLRQQRDLLVSIPGVGETTAAKLLGENLPTNIQQSSSKKPFGTTCWAKYGHIPVLQSLEGNHTKRIHFRLSPNDRLGPRSSTCAVAGRAKRARARAHRGGSRRHSLAAEGDARMTGRDSHPSPASVTLR